MKKLSIVIILSLLYLQPLHGEETAMLRIKISGESANNPHFLCINDVGCVNINAGNHGKAFPINPGSISYIVPVTIATLHLHPQILPKSCNVEIKSNKTITITGSLKTGINDTVYINHLSCKVS